MSTALHPRVFEQAVEKKPHEHYLTHQHGGSASVLLWGPTVCPKSGKIHECAFSELLERWELWSRIYEWWNSVGEQNPASRMPLSEADRHLLSSLHSVWFIMQCSPDKAQLKSVRARAKLNLSNATKQQRFVAMPVGSLRREAAGLRAIAVEAQKDGRVLVEIAESTKTRAKDREHYYGMAAVILTDQHNGDFSNDIMAQFCAEGCRTFVFGPLPCKSPDIRVVIIGREHTVGDCSVLELGWVAAANPRSGERSGTQAIRQLMRRCQQEQKRSLLVKHPLTVAGAA